MIKHDLNPPLTPRKYPDLPIKTKKEKYIMNISNAELGNRSRSFKVNSLRRSLPLPNLERSTQLKFTRNFSELKLKSNLTSARRSRQVSVLPTI
jgi:hypothetical protein